jgi:hypothetical protein
MRRVCLLVGAVIAFSLPARTAWSGPNAGGTLVVHDAGLPVSGVNPSVPVCGQGNIPVSWCEVDARIDGSGPTDHRVWKIYAAFPTGSSPRLFGVAFGINYDPNLLVITNEVTRPCGDGVWELPDLNWPEAGAGNSVTWSPTRTTQIVPIYAFSGYALGPTSFYATPNPSGGGYFGDDTVPSRMDDIAGYGELGFGIDGAVAWPAGALPGACCDPDNGGCAYLPQTCCADPQTWHGAWSPCSPNPCPQPGACCAPEGRCTFTTASACPAPNDWLGISVACTPDPCPVPVPVERTTWGRIKSNFR